MSILVNRGFKHDVGYALRDATETVNLPSVRVHIYIVYKYLYISFPTHKFSLAAHFIL